MATKGRYPSDVTEAQWELVAPLLSAVGAGGRPEAHPRREVVNAILYLVRTGCSWRQLPKDFPPWETVYWHFARWRDDRSLDRLHDALRERVRRAEGRDEQPTAAIIDAQSVKGAARAPRAQSSAMPKASHSKVKSDCESDAEHQRERPADRRSGMSVVRLPVEDQNRGNDHSKRNDSDPAYRMA
jgi:transposase